MEHAIENELDLARRDEWENWQRVCEALKAAGAVTDADLASPVSDLSTVGTVLLNRIRQWGASLQTLSRIA